MNNLPFNSTEYIKVKCFFPQAKLTGRANSISLGCLNDNRDNTCEFRIYKYADGYRVRRVIKGWNFSFGGRSRGSYNSVTPYQLFRNSRTGAWPAFVSIQQVAERIKKSYAGILSQEFSPINV